MAMYANLLQARIAEVAIDAGRLIHGDDSIAVVDAVATVDDKGENWAISLMNRHPSAAVACTLRLGGEALNGSIKATLLTADSADAYNDIEHPERVVAKKTALVFKQGACNLPPHSLTIVDLAVNN